MPEVGPILPLFLCFLQQISTISAQIAYPYKDFKAPSTTLKLSRARAIAELDDSTVVD